MLHAMHNGTPSHEDLDCPDQCRTSAAAQRSVAFTLDHKVGCWTGGVSAPTHRRPVDADGHVSDDGRTELKIGASRAKNCEEFNFEVRLPVQPPKLAQKGETNASRPNKFVKNRISSPKIELTGIV